MTSFTSLLFDFLIIILSCGCALYAVCAYLQNKWTRKGIPYSNLHPIFGNMKEVFVGKKVFLEKIKDFYLEHKNKPFIGFFSFTQPMVMINDLELVKSILVKDFSSFTDRNFYAPPSDPLQHHNLFTNKGQTWKNMRVKLTPTFTTGKMKRMFEFIDKCGQELLTCVDREVGSNGNVEMKTLASRFTTDCIAAVAFGINGNSLKDRESVFGKYLRKTVTSDWWQTIVSILMFVTPKLVEKLSLSITKTDVADFFRKTVWDTVDYREKNNVRRDDFLGLLMQVRKSGSLNDDPLDEGEVLEKSTDNVDLEGDKFVAQCFIFLLAGFETSSGAMTNTLYELALQPEMQNRVYEEIKSVLSKHDNKLSYDAIQEMEYFHMVVQETMRKYPALLFLDRQVTKPYRLPGTNIELQVGDSVMIPLVGLHHDPDFYPEPQRFDPERFNEEQRKARPPYSYLPFGDGPRICIGMRLGYLQTKVGLIYTLLNYEVSPIAETPIPLVYKNLAFPQLGNIPLRLKKRSA